ncbi:uncharacterized protein LOC127009476 [Eriocheir sinensis]|uniref:uncharacterized protein LOC127009476 n=1 Tax=Eriocheir sinensis TaxID=95602 RepID=UPI0021C798CA|nr:uncharacterized protein LOC127009476 [Eriocheir sinensis]
MAPTTEYSRVPTAQKEDKEPSWKEDCTGWKFDLQLDGEQIEDVQLSCLAERTMTFRPSNKLWSTGGMAALHHSSCHRWSTGSMAALHHSCHRVQGQLGRWATFRSSLSVGKNGGAC